MGVGLVLLVGYTEQDVNVNKCQVKYYFEEMMVVVRGKVALLFLLAMLLAMTSVVAPVYAAGKDARGDQGYRWKQGDGNCYQDYDWDYCNDCGRYYSSGSGYYRYCEYCDYDYDNRSYSSDNWNRNDSYQRDRGRTSTKSVTVRTTLIKATKVKVEYNKEVKTVTDTSVLRRDDGRNREFLVLAEDACELLRVSREVRSSEVRGGKIKFTVQNTRRDSVTINSIERDGKRFVSLSEVAEGLGLSLPTTVSVTYKK